MRLCIKKALLLLLLSIVNVSFSAQRSYTINVESQSASAKSTAEKQAFEQLLQYMTMSEDYTLEPERFAGITPAQFVESFAYQQQNDGLKLTIYFDRAELAKALEERGIVVVSDNRPALMVLEAVQESGQEMLIGEPTGGIYHDLLQEQAKERGLTLLFPLMDLDDVQTLSFSSVWSESPIVLWDKVQRYHPQGLLIGKVIVQADGGVNADWTLNLRERSYHWEIAEESIQGMLAMLMNNIAASYRELFVMTTQSSQRMMIRVDGVHEASTLNRVTLALKVLEGVTDVSTKTMSSESVTFDVTMIGDQQELADALSMNAHFRQIDTEFLGDAPVLVYEWRN